MGGRGKAGRRWRDRWAGLWGGVYGFGGIFVLAYSWDTTRVNFSFLFFSFVIFFFVYFSQ